MIKVSQTGMVLSLVHKTLILITEFIWWISLVEITIQLRLLKLNSTLNATFHASTNKPDKLIQINSPCLKTGTQLTQWKKFWSESRMKWSTIRSLPNQLMVICIEANLADLVSLTFSNVPNSVATVLILIGSIHFTLKSSKYIRAYTPDHWK